MLPPPPKNYKISSAFSYNFKLAVTVVSAATPRTALLSSAPCGTFVPAPHSSALFVCRFGYPATVLLSFPDSLSGLFSALSGVYRFSSSSTTKLHFFLCVFFHFITSLDSLLQCYLLIQKPLIKAAYPVHIAAERNLLPMIQP